MHGGGSRDPGAGQALPRGRAADRGCRQRRVRRLALRSARRRGRQCGRARQRGAGRRRGARRCQHRLLPVHRRSCSAVAIAGFPLWGLGEGRDPLVRGAMARHVHRPPGQRRPRSGRSSKRTGTPRGLEAGVGGVQVQHQPVRRYLEAHGEVRGPQRQTVEGLAHRRVRPRRRTICCTGASTVSLPVTHDPSSRPCSRWCRWCPGPYAPGVLAANAAAHVRAGSGGWTDGPGPAFPPSLVTWTQRRQAQRRRPGRSTRCTCRRPDGGYVRRRWVAVRMPCPTCTD